MGNADVHLLHTEALADVSSTPTQCDRGATSFIVANLNIQPPDAAGPTGAHCFEDCFFCRPAACIVLRCRGSSAAVSDFRLREYSIEKQLAVPLNHLRDSQTFDNVCANTNDVHIFIPQAR